MIKNKSLDLDYSFEKGVEVAKLVMPVISPFVQGLLWYGFTRIDKRADALNNLIAFAEILPTVDLNLPKGVVLAALYDKTGDAMKLINDLVQALKDIPDKVKQQVEDIKDDIEDLIPDIPDIPDIPSSAELTNAFIDCTKNAKDNLGFSFPLIGPTWIASCMLQKGFPVTTKWIKDKLGL